MPADLPAAVALTALDVYPSASYVQTIAGPGAHVVVLGAGHAGLLALAAAREVIGRDGVVTVVDVSDAALEGARKIDPDARTIRADVRDTIAVVDQLVSRGDLGRGVLMNGTEPAPTMQAPAPAMQGLPRTHYGAHTWLELRELSRRDDLVIVLRPELRAWPSAANPAHSSVRVP